MGKEKICISRDCKATDDCSHYSKHEKNEHCYTQFKTCGSFIDFFETEKEAERERSILQRWPEVEKYLRRKIISLQKVQTELESTGRELELAELRKLLGDKQ